MRHELHRRSALWLAYAQVHGGHGVFLSFPITNRSVRRHDCIWLPVSVKSAAHGGGCGLM